MSDQGNPEDAPFEILDPVTEGVVTETVVHTGSEGDPAAKEAHDGTPQEAT